MYISGKWRTALPGNGIAITNPYNGATVSEVPRATVTDVAEAIAAAYDHRGQIAELAAHERAAILKRTSEKINANREELARLLVSENGKTIRQCRFEIDTTARLFESFGEEAKRLEGTVYPMDSVQGLERSLCFTMREPMGVIVGIVPFNYPVELWAHKAAPAIAAGNSSVFLLPVECPLTVMRIGEYILESGLPAQTIQFITGYGHEVGDALVSDKRVRMITFTGSVPTALRIARESSNSVKHLHLELGGIDPIIVCEDADLENAVDAVVAGRLTNGAGQICCAAKRIYVHQSIFDAFNKRLVEAVTGLVMGDPMNEATDIGPMIHQRAVDKVAKQVAASVEAGALVLIGGNVRNGLQYEPTVIVNVTDSMSVICDEVFGPVAPIVSFQTLEEAILAANDTDTGLQASIYTKDLNNALYAAKRIQAGGIMVNGSTAFRPGHIPFGGYNQSGRGRESLVDTINEMMETKTVVIHNCF